MSDMTRETRVVVDLSPPRAERPAVFEIVAAALEWVAAHEFVSDPRSPDPEALERYSEACNDLLAVVSQNRAALADEASDAELASEEATWD